MSDPTPIDAGHQVLVLAFDLVDAEIPRLPNQIQEALQSAHVQQAIHKTLIDFAKTKYSSAPMVVSQEEAEKLIKSMGTAAVAATGDELTKSIKRTPEYQKLEASLLAFKKAAASSSLGVWIDKNKTTLYIVGAALVVGTAGVLYVTKTGGPLLDTALDPLKGKDFEVLTIGALKIKAGLLDFRPDARVLGARVSSTAEWDKLKMDLSFGILAEGATVQKIHGETVLKSGPLSFTAQADVVPKLISRTSASSSAIRRAASAWAWAQPIRTTPPKARSRPSIRPSTPSLGCKEISANKRAPGSSMAVS